jgi:hypothetical protein
MSGERLTSATRFLVLALSTLYGLAAIGGLSVGAALGGLPLFWTLIVPIAVSAVIACSIAVVRRRTSVTA